MMKKEFVWLLALILIVHSGCNRPIEDNEKSEYPVKIILVHKSGSNRMQLGSEITNPHGEKVTLNAFAYYLSHFALTDANGKKQVLPVEYFLVDEKAAPTKTINFKVPEGTYQSIEWLIGVDSTRNVSGVQSGALDPANGMFWSWNTGYIFAKMEGKSPVSTAPLQNVTYHIGGFRQVENALQTVTLLFPQPLKVAKAGNPSIEIEANSDAWFQGASDLKIAESAFTMTPGPLAQRISQNYARMFSVKSVNN